MEHRLKALEETILILGKNQQKLKQLVSEKENELQSFRAKFERQDKVFNSLIKDPIKCPQKAIDITSCHQSKFVSYQ